MASSRSASPAAWSSMVELKTSIRTNQTLAIWPPCHSRGGAPPPSGLRRSASPAAVHRRISCTSPVSGSTYGPPPPTHTHRNAVLAMSLIGLRTRPSSALVVHQTAVAPELQRLQFVKRVGECMQSASREKRGRGAESASRSSAGGRPRRLAACRRPRSPVHADSVMLALCGTDPPGHRCASWPLSSVESICERRMRWPGRRTWPMRVGSSSSSSGSSSGTERRPTTSQRKSNHSRHSSCTGAAASTRKASTRGCILPDERTEGQEWPSRAP